MAYFPLEPSNRGGFTPPNTLLWVMPFRSPERRFLTPILGVQLGGQFGASGAGVISALESTSPLNISEDEDTATNRHTSFWHTYIPTVKADQSWTFWWKLTPPIGVGLGVNWGGVNWGSISDLFLTYFWHFFTAENNIGLGVEFWPIFFQFWHNSDTFF